jgi:hypothetical protein
MCFALSSKNVTHLSEKLDVQVCANVARRSFLVLMLICSRLSQETCLFDSCFRVILTSTVCVSQVFRVGNNLLLRLTKDAKITPTEGDEVEYEAPITALANTYTMHKVSLLYFSLSLLPIVLLHQRSALPYSPRFHSAKTLGILLALPPSYFVFFLVCCAAVRFVTIVPNITALFTHCPSPLSLRIGFLGDSSYAGFPDIILATIVKIHREDI